MIFIPFVTSNDSFFVETFHDKGEASQRVAQYREEGTRPVSLSELIRVAGTGKTIRNEPRGRQSFEQFASQSLNPTCPGCSIAMVKSKWQAKPPYCKKFFCGENCPTGERKFIAQQKEDGDTDFHIKGNPSHKL